MSEEVAKNSTWRMTLLTFLWRHALKFLSTAFVAFCYAVYAFIQMPYKAQADIATLQESQAAFQKEYRTEMATLKTATGVNTVLLERVDGKMDKIQTAIIKLSVQRRNEDYR